MKSSQGGPARSNESLCSAMYFRKGWEYMGAFRTAILLLAISVLWLSSAKAMLPTADDFAAPPAREPVDCDRILESVDARRPLVTQIPDADQLLKFLRSRRASDVRRCLQERRRRLRLEVQDVRPIDGTTPLGNVNLSTPFPGPPCDRPLPTKREFLMMLKQRPADAHQILKRCPVPIRSISPIRQLPVGNRQLPVDTRQRPVGTWGKDMRHGEINRW